MITYEHENLFREDSVNKQWTAIITQIDNGKRTVVATIHNEDILDDSIKITETLASDGLNFGRCEPSKVELTVYNTYGSYKGCELKLLVSLNDNPDFTIGTYIIETDTPTADRYHRKIEAYDFLYTINNKDVSDWYNALEFPITIKTMRDNFFSYLGYEQETVPLCNDYIKIEKTVDTEDGVSGGSILSAICDTNGVFGHITRDNKFRYISLDNIQKGGYPKDDLYPNDDVYPSVDLVDTVYTKDEWTSLTFEDFECKGIDGVYVLDSDGEIYASSGDCLNPYELKQNFLLYGMEDGSTDDAKQRKIRNSIVNIASSYIGRTYDSKKNIIFVTDYYGKEQDKKVPYCCIFVWYVYRACSASEYFYGGNKTASCTTLLDFYRTYFPDRVHTDLSRCKAGDLVFYQFDTDPGAEHVGIFESSINSTSFYAIEGNTSYENSGGQTNKGYVARKVRETSKVMAFVNINFPEDTMKTSLLQEICDNLYSHVKGLSYRPFSMEAVADPCVEVGDRIRTNSRDMIVYTYCMQRRLNGVQYITDTIDSFGVEDRSDNVSSVKDELKRLQNKIRKDAEFTNVKLTTLTASTVVIRNHLSAAEADITELYTTNATISGRVDLTENSIINLDGTVESHGKKIVTVEKKADDLEEYYITLSANYVEISNGLGTANTNIISVRTVANGAKDSADKAQSTADGAASTASSAKKTADAAAKEIVTIKADYMKTSELTADKILTTLSSPDQGTLTVGNVRAGTYYIYMGNNTYNRIKQKSATINGTTITYMTWNA